MSVLILALAVAQPAVAQSDFPYSATTTSGCDPQASSFALVGPQGNSVYSFGALDKADGVNSTDFNGQIFTSITFLLCGYTTDSTPDPNPINFGVVTVTTGVVSPVLGSVTFDSIAHCNPTIPSPNTCKSTAPTRVTVSGAGVSAASSKTQSIGLAFPGSSTASHVVEDICANLAGSSSCTTTAMLHGGITETFYAGNPSYQPGTGLATATTFTPCPWSQSNTIGQNAGCGLAQGASLVALVAEVYFGMLFAVIVANSARQGGGAAMVSYLRRTSPVLVIVGALFLIAAKSLGVIP